MKEKDFTGEKIYHYRYLTQHTIALFLLFITILGIISYVSIFAPVIGITYDEAVNYASLSSLGYLISLTNYSVANNHIFFTFLQSFIVPPIPLLQIFPELTRTLNVIVGASLFLSIYLISVHITGKRTLYLFAVIAFICFFLSPLDTTFYIAARGYLLGLFLLLIGIYLLSINRYYSSAIFFILSGWTLPTYTYCFPFLYISALYFGEKKRIHVILSAFVVVVGLYLCYRQIMAQVFVQGITWYSDSMIDLLYKTWQSLTNFSYLPYGSIINFLYSIVYILSLIFVLRSKYFSEEKKFIIYLTSAIGSYLFVVCVTSLLFIANPPFLRNGVFIPLFTGITILTTALTVPKKTAICLWIMLLANALVGLYFFTTDISFNERNPYLVVVGYLSPVYFPISSSERKLLKEKKLKSILLTEPASNTIVDFFSKIYSVPVTDLTQNTVTPNATSSSRQVNIVSITPDKEPRPLLLSTNPLYWVKSAYENSLLKFLLVLSNYENRRTKLITYLFSLTNAKYAEGDMLWRKGNHKMALGSFISGESIMHLIIQEIKQSYMNEGQDPTKIQEFLSSNALHENILRKLMLYKPGQLKKQLANILSQTSYDEQAINAVSPEKSSQ